MCDKILRDEAEHFYSHLQTFPEAKHLAISGDYDLVLDIKQTKNLGFQWSYYYVSHSNQCIFWLKENDISPIVAGVGSQSLAHISMLYFSQHLNLKLIILTLRAPAQIPLLVSLPSVTR